MRQEFTMLVPLSYAITSNRSAEVWKRKTVKDQMQALTRLAARRVAPMGRATIHVGIIKRTAGRYDPVNLTDTFKGCPDALVRMGVLAEDDHTHVLGPFLYHRGVDRTIPAGHMRAVVTLTDYRATPVEVD